MVINKDIVFLHLQKCGGTFVKHVLEDNLSAVNVRPEHNGYLDIVDPHKGKFIFGTIRNPYSWYVSLYHKHRKDENSYMKSLFAGDPSFSEWVNKFVNIKKGYIHDMNFGQISSLDIGPYTYRALNCYGLNRSPATAEDIKFADIDYIKMENLNPELARILSPYASEEICESIISKEKVHTGKHEHFSVYYTPETLELVAHKDRLLFDQWGYDK